MGLWTEHVLPRLTDRLLDNDYLHRQRAVVCRGLRGRVLEIGFGSGLNVEHYPPQVEQVAAVEPNDDAWRIARQRVRRSAMPVVRAGLDGQRLDEPDASVDAVLSTFTMCTLPDLDRALAEARRVLRPGGELHFLEHGRAPDAGVVTWQRRLEPLQKWWGGGCHLTRDPLAALGEAGFEVVEHEEWYLPGPAVSRPAGYLYRGVARAAR